MRKVDDGEEKKRKEKKEKKRKEKKEKRMAFLVATTSLPAVFRPNGYDDHWNAARSCQNYEHPCPFFFKNVSIGTSVRRSSGRRLGVAVWAVDCWQ